jgi:hypothetical protein
MTKFSAGDSNALSDLIPEREAESNPPAAVWRCQSKRHGTFGSQHPPDRLGDEDGFTRLANQALFEGPVRRGAGVLRR